MSLSRHPFPVSFTQGEDDSLHLSGWDICPGEEASVCLGDAGRWVDQEQREQRCLQAKMGRVETGQAGALGIFRVYVGLQVLAVKLLADTGHQ